MYTIRNLSEQDLHDWLQLRQQALPELRYDVHIEEIRHILNNPMLESQRRFLATAAEHPPGILVGFAETEMLRSLPFTDIRLQPNEMLCSINSLFVHPDYRNRGVGRALIEQCDDWCRTQFIAGIAAAVPIRSADMLAFYRRCGMRLHGKSRYTDLLYRPVPRQHPGTASAL